MRLRLLLALIALAGLTAFAPAPFPRPRRDRDGLDLARFQGTWKVVSMQETLPGGALREYRWHISHIRVSADRWTFLQTIQGRVTDNASYFLTLNAGKQPATLDFHPERGRPASMLGIIRRKGELVQVLYLGGGNVRPASFEPPPQGYYLITLKRER